MLLDNADITVGCYSTFRNMCGNVVLWGALDRNLIVDVLTQLWNKQNDSGLEFTYFVEVLSVLETYEDGSEMEHLSRENLGSVESNLCRLIPLFVVEVEKVIGSLTVASCEDATLLLIHLLHSKNFIWRWSEMFWSVLEMLGTLR